MKLKVVRGRQFGQERVTADGREFIDCTFDGTVLAFAGRDVFMFGEGTGGSFVLDFTGAAGITLNQLAALHRFGMTDHVETLIARIRNPLDETAH